MKEIFTGKCLEKFEAYLENKEGSHYYTPVLFDTLPFEIQVWIRIEFLDSIKVYISDEYNEVDEYYQWFIPFNPVKDDVNCGGYNSRQEYITKALLSANTLINQSHQEKNK